MNLNILLAVVGRREQIVKIKKQIKIFYIHIFHLLRLKILFLYIAFIWAMQSCINVDLLEEKNKMLKIPDLVKILHFLQERDLVRREKFLI